jgi:hypothetical protein
MNQGISMVALCTEYRGRWIFPILGFRIVPVPARLRREAQTASSRDSTDYYVLYILRTP